MLCCKDVYNLQAVLDLVGTLFVQNPHVMMHNPTFTVGQGRQCDLCVGDPAVSKSLCSLKHMESEVYLSLPLVTVVGDMEFIIAFKLSFQFRHLYVNLREGSLLLCFKLLERKELSKLMASFTQKIPLFL